MEEDAEIQAALQNTVLLKVNGGIEGGRDMARAHHVRAFPTFVALNAAGEELSGWVGYGDASAWRQRLEAIKADPVTLAERRVRCAAEPNFTDAFALGESALRTGECAAADAYFEQAAGLDPAAAAAEEVELKRFQARIRGVASGEYTMAKATDYVRTLLERQDLVPRYALEITEQLVRAGERIGSEAISPYIAMARPHVEKIEAEALQERKQRFMVNHALFVEQDEDRAVRLMKATLSEDWHEDPAALNRFAWWSFTHRVNLQEAELLARRAVELSEPGALQANALDTLAELVNLRGNEAEARQLIERALELDPENEYLQNQLTRFAGEQSS